MISAAFSLFSGGLRGGSVCSNNKEGTESTFGSRREGAGGREEGRTNEQDVVILRLSSEVLEDALLPEPLHVIPVVDQSVFDGVMERVGSEEGEEGGKEKDGELDRNKRAFVCELARKERKEEDDSL